MKTIAAVLALAVLSTPLSAARHRAVRFPSTSIGDTAPAAWLAAHASTIRTTDLVSDTSDLAPIRQFVGNASVVGLGDGTHGTHEFYTLKLRLIDSLVRDLGFDLVAFEAAAASFDDINAYVLGGSGDPRVLLENAGYVFWKCDELVEVLEWMRDYNAHRGDRPPVQIAGADQWAPRGPAENVVAYLDGVDHAAASAARHDYQCVLEITGLFPLGCKQSDADAAYARLAARRADLGSGSGAAAFEEALHNARLVVQSFSPIFERDRNMAENVRWLLEHRSHSGRMIYWAHSEHVGKTINQQTPRGSAGMFLRDTLGAAYLNIGTLTGSGQYITWVGTGPVALDVPVPQNGTYEANLQLGARPAIFVPMHGTVPDWLRGPARYLLAAAAPIGDDPYLTDSLPEKFDAVIYVHATTPIHVFSQ